ncbi:MAG: NlpC/P60 family protein [Bacteroidales bacterium]|nr:NlpC/P60 family protein [Bacteroidales bacterium]MDY0216277.1 NlpC/P60 family protein [Bacteroidales bacterium]
MRKIFSFLLIISLVLCSFHACKPKKRPIAKRPATEKEIIKPTSSSSKTKVIKAENDALNKAVNFWLGTPHKNGGCNKSGIDCSCLVMSIYKEVYGIDLYRSSIDIQKNVFFVNKSELKEGDILFFKTTSADRVTHVGIYLKNDEFVHTSTSKGVIISNLNEAYYQRTFFKAGRHLKVK